MKHLNVTSVPMMIEILENTEIEICYHHARKTLALDSVMQAEYALKMHNSEEFARHLITLIENNKEG
jgi:hypothetical protein